MLVITVLLILILTLRLLSFDAHKDFTFIDKDTSVSDDSIDIKNYIINDLISY